MDLFTSKDFKVFDLPGFQERMDALRKAIRPKLTSIGEALAPKVSAAVDRPLFVHVAKHARRTVNPPNDTWAALGCDYRGYKKDVHFRVAVSRNCVRLLFTAGAEYYDKIGWVRAWNGQAARIARNLRELYWFRDEHEEQPTSGIQSPAEARKLGAEFTRRRDGQFVVGRRIGSKEFTRMDAGEFETLAVETFRELSPLFNLHEPRRKN